MLCILYCVALSLLLLLLQQWCSYIMPTRYSFNGYLYAVFHGQVSSLIIVWYLALTACMQRSAFKLRRYRVRASSESKQSHMMHCSTAAVRSATVKAVRALTHMLLH